MENCIIHHHAIIPFMGVAFAGPVLRQKGVNRCCILPSKVTNCAGWCGSAVFRAPSLQVDPGQGTCPGRGLDPWWAECRRQAITGTFLSPSLCLSL